MSYGTWVFIRIECIMYIFIMEHEEYINLLYVDIFDIL